MTMTDDELLALARKATPGPYHVGDERLPVLTAMGVLPHRHIALLESVREPDFKTNAKYLAALAPENIIALIERHRAERAEWDAHAGQWKATLDEQRAEVDGKDALLNDYINANARLTRERDEALAAVKDTLAKLGDRSMCERLDSAEATLSAAQKRIAELEALVRQAVDEKDGPEPPHALGSEWHDRARAALAGKEDGGSPSPLIRS